MGRGEGKSEWFRALVGEQGWGVGFPASGEGSGGLGAWGRQTDWATRMKKRGGGGGGGVVYQKLHVIQ